MKLNLGTFARLCNLVFHMTWNIEYRRRLRFSSPEIDAQLPVIGGKCLDR